MSVDSTPASDQARLRLRQVHRAASELRRGVPVVLRGDTSLLVLAAETAGADGLLGLEAIAGAPPGLIVAPARAAAILRAPMPAGAAPVAVTLPDLIGNLEVYH